MYKSQEQTKLLLHAKINLYKSWHILKNIRAINMANNTYQYKTCRQFSR